MSSELLNGNEWLKMLNNDKDISFKNRVVMPDLFDGITIRDLKSNFKNIVCQMLNGEVNKDDFGIYGNKLYINRIVTMLVELPNVSNIIDIIYQAFDEATMKMQEKIEMTAKFDADDLLNTFDLCTQRTKMLKDSLFFQFK
jgi:hypothetical protein